MDGKRTDLVLAAGTYNATVQDAEGTYYVGPKACISLKVIVPNFAQPNALVGKVQTSDCGIYVPFAPDRPVWIFRPIKPAKVLNWDVAGSEPEAEPASDYGKQQFVVTTALQNSPTAGPVAAGVGAALGMAIAEALVDQDKIIYQRIFFYPTKTVHDLDQHITRM